MTFTTEAEALCLVCITAASDTEGLHANHQRRQSRLIQVLRLASFIAANRAIFEVFALRTRRDGDESVFCEAGSLETDTHTINARQLSKRGRSNKTEFSGSVNTQHTMRSRRQTRMVDPPPLK